MLVRDYAKLDNLCKSRTKLPKWKCSKEMRVDKDNGGGMKNPDQILARGGVDGGLPPNRGIHHSDQSGGHLNDRNSTHEGGGDEAGEVAYYAAPEREDCGVLAVPLGEHLVGQAGPRFPGLVGLTRRDGENLEGVRIELGPDAFCVEGLDVRVGDERIPVSGCNLPSECPDSR